MPWYQEYIDNQHWHEAYRQEAERMLGSCVDDVQNCCAEAVAKLLMERLPNATLAHDGNRDGFVMHCFRNILTDMKRKVNGRIRPPLKMRQMGPPIQAIYGLHCIDKRSDEDIATELGLPEEVVKYWTRWLKAEGRYPTIRMNVLSLTDDDVDPTNLAASGSGDVVGDDYERAEIVSLISFLFEIGDPNEELQTVLSVADNRELPSTLIKRLTELRNSIQLSLDERLLLRLRAVEMKPRKYIAKRLGVSISTIQNREAKLYGRLHVVLLNAGFQV